jgi:uncharacterized membrane protein
MRVRIGDFLRTGDIIADLEGGGDPGKLADRAGAAFTLGAEALGREDIGLGLTRLAEVAVRALSPGMNDPGTACACLDALSEVLVTLGCREAPHPVRTGPASECHVRVVARYHEFDDLVSLALSPVRHHGAGAPSVMARLFEVIGAIGTRVPTGRRGTLVRQAELALQSLDHAIEPSHEREPLRQRAEAVLRELRA